jgi:hypothetical protein
MLCGRACCVNIKIYVWIVAEVINLGGGKKDRNHHRGHRGGPVGGVLGLYLGPPPVVQKRVCKLLKRKKRRVKNAAKRGTRGRKPMSQKELVQG